MGKPSAPKAPDPVATANAQSASNRETAITQTGLNAINQYGPTGSITYAQNGKWADGTPRFTQTTSLSPEQQVIFDTGVRTQGNLANVAENQSKTIGDILSKQFTTEGAPALTTSLSGANDYSAERQRVEDALMGRLNTQIDRDREQLAASLANRGIRLGSDAYSDAMKDFGQNVADSRTSAILNAGQEQNRLQGLELNAGNFANSARSQYLNELLNTRNQALNENIGLATGTQVGTPQFSATPTTGVAGTDVAGINQGIYNGQLAAYGNQMNQWNSGIGGLFGLGSSALMAAGNAGGLGALFSFSDKRLKQDIEPTGEKVGGVPVKTWTWKGSGERDVGVIAQDVEKKHPELVDHSHPSGFRRVNYAGLMQLGASAQRRAA